MTYEELVSENEKLRTENQLLKNIDRDDFFNMATDFLCTFFRRRFLQVNPAFIDALGYSKEYLLSHHIHEFLHPDDIETTFQIILDYIHKEGKLSTQNRYRCANGSYIMISWDLYVKANGVAYAIGRDITKQYELEQAIKQSEQVLKSLFNSNSYIFVIFDRNLKILKINENAKRAIHLFLGTDLKKDSTFIDVLPTDMHEITQQRIVQVLEGETISYERKVTHRFSGQDLWFQATMTPLYVDNEIFGVCYAANDITKHKEMTHQVTELLMQEKTMSEELKTNNEELKTNNEELWQNLEEMRTMEEYLKLSELNSQKAEKDAILNKERLEHIFDNLDSHFFWVIDPKTGQVILLSQGFEKILGYATKEILNFEDALQEIAYKDDLAILSTLYREALRGNSPKNIEFRAVTATGEIKWLAAQSKIYFGEDRNIISIEGIITDITANKMAEITLKKNIQELQKTQKELEYKNQELDTFVYRASHDLRGPIATILGLCDILKMENMNEITNESTKNYYTLINERTERLDQILKELMDVTQIKEVKIVYQRIDFQHLIHRTKLNLTNLPNFHAVKWEVHIAPQVLIYTDEHLLQVIVQHLAENAINFARIVNNNAYLRITVEESKNNMFCLTVVDNGQGIPKEAVSKIFNMFYRGSEDANGSGLGLYILRNALERLDGTVEVRTVLGAGTTFIVQIPNQN